MERKKYMKYPFLLVIWFEWESYHLGNMGEKHLDIRALYTQANMFFFDPGFTVTGSCASAITYSNSEGLLLYRGYAI